LADVGIVVLAVDSGTIPFCLVAHVQKAKLVKPAQLIQDS
jgi:hypothetical protein